MADTLQNVLEDPRIVVALVVPGSVSVVEVVGTATVSTSDTLCRLSEVRGKTPKLGIVIHVDSARLYRSSGIEASGMWEPSAHLGVNALPSMGEMIADPGASGGVKERIARAVINRVNDVDSRVNLY